MRNNKYQVQLDFLIFSSLAFLACIIIWICVYFVEKNERYSAMRYDAITLSYYAITYDFQHKLSDGEKVKLKELIDSKYYNKILNPFGNGYCNEEESYILKSNNKYYVTLKCGNYIIEDYAYTNTDEVKIYNATNGIKLLVKVFNDKGDDNNETK